MDIIRNQQDGDFILMKDYSNPKPLIKLFRVATAEPEFNEINEQGPDNLNDEVEEEN
jgi:hypothetical protein